MNIKMRFTCSECLHDLDVVSTYAEDVDGFPAVNISVKTCESCLFDATDKKEGEL